MTPYRLAADGFEIHDCVLSHSEVDVLLAEIADPLAGHKPSRRAGLRNLLRDAPGVRNLAHSSALLDLVAPMLGLEARPVSVVLFDKTPQANWAVPWHQDVTIAVAEKIEAADFGGWSVKEGVQHVQAPEAVLDGMVTVRLHLDECDQANGPLRVLRASHRYGKLNEAGVVRCKMGCEEVTCAVPRGGALLMRPLLLHASSPAATPRHRRVLHLEFTNAPLPGGLRWFADSAGCLSHS